MMPVVPGYESLGPNVIPPSDLGPARFPAPCRAQERRFDIPAISEELAQEAFISYASSECCFSTKPAREMVFTDLRSLNTYRYLLETFTESRTKEWGGEPYNGQVVDDFREPPDPWSIPVPTPSLFQDCQKHIRIPHTSIIKGCHSCLSLGRSACRTCVNSGRTRCSSCGGSGRTEHDFCRSCQGSGMSRCHSCGGAGSVTCETCKGHGKLLCFITLKITWKNNIYVAVIDKGSGFPVKLLNQISGEKLLTDMAPKVYPVVSFPDSSVNAASESGVREHQAQFSTTCRILQQRQTIELIPITRVHYVWHEKTHVYFVYGAEHKVYSRDYPARCCCCSVL
ncbi:ssu-2 homolog, tandem duplicate 2 isoform X2 [Puntigrus tetrazona]|nr:ssu-2 homolog, tandem duplicate 2 isoform X2 [Puntigrus tetrazona]